MTRQAVTEELIREWSGGRAFDRGKVYFAQDRVEDLSVTESAATAVVDGSSVYDVRLDLADGRMWGECSCPQGDDGKFCKHCVATALAWMAEAGPLSVPEPPDKISDEALRTFLASQEHGWLAEELMRAATAAPMVRARLEVAAGAEAKNVLATERLRRDLALSVRIDDDETEEWLDGVKAAFAKVTDLSKAGFTGEATELAEYAIDLLAGVAEEDRFLVHQALAEAGRIHLAACSDGHPDPRALADRLVDQALATGTLFVDALPGYAGALGPDGLARYRERVEQAWRDLEPDPAGDPPPTAVLLRERLAEHEGGADGLITLAAGEPSSRQVLRIARVLAGEGKDGSALEWIRGGLARFDGEVALNDFGLDVDLRTLGAECLLRAGDQRGAVEFLWPVFIDSPSVRTYGMVAEAAGAHWPRWRERALTRLSEKLARYQTDHRFNVLVEIMLSEQDSEGAWQVARAGGVSQDLRLRAARARGATHPAEAYPVLLEAAEAAIEEKKKRQYAWAAQLLAEAQLLAGQCGHGQKFDQHMAGLRAEHKAKSALRAELNQARLP
ncbi:hypothetical protein Acor_45400 [Acrocarpospora corrugata]|uniref:SWIM-type domain-containing protein n=1 Tax=Acrocarpospora corrugata TaxID=35763 RepID=A0A5M3W163_9ACTN|nr:hypothetical protein [Acrocarpospora corrugata]GES02474.1 hypothetical protein Acor_45400 [Acrocarpospora corrugata]